MFQLQEKISMELSTNNSIWSWAMRHASWLLNRFGVTHGTTPYELVYSKPYKGKLASFGEPIFAYVNVAQKGNAKWQRVIMLGENGKPRHVCGVYRQWCYADKKCEEDSV